MKNEVSWQQVEQKTIFQPYLEGALRKCTVCFDLDHVKAMQKIPLQINKCFYT